MMTRISTVNSLIANLAAASIVKTFPTNFDEDNQTCRNYHNRHSDYLAIRYFLNVEGSLVTSLKILNDCQL